MGDASDSPSGIRHVDGAKLNQALVRNVRTYTAMLKGKGASGANREAESTDAPVRGGLLRSSEEAGVMPVERREQAIAVELGSTGSYREEPECSAEGGSLRAMARAG